MKEWSEERTALLKTMWTGGKSARLIAKELGVTRNAIIGKARRLGLEARAEARKRPDPHLVTKVANPPKRRGAPYNPAVSQKCLSAGVSILDVGHDQCRAIIDTGGNPNGLALMCGRPVYGNTSWCEKHLLKHTTVRRA